MLYCLHGTLGTPKDWELIPFKRPYKAVDLYNKYADLSLEGFAKQFNRDVASDGEEMRVLVGYSLGGRLALHALIDNPGLWDCAVIISANPGFSQDTEKEPYLKRDLKWSRLFKSEPINWQNVFLEWEAEDVFKNAQISFERDPKDYNIKALSSSFENWSVGGQKDLTSQINDLHIPILWVTGEGDKKYQTMAKWILLRHQLSGSIMIEQSAHRVPWENPHRFTAEVEKFLRRC
jgi:2-succinyl-6-hydroxy-2,4-cyclohexadiene-1-carboxylate synthase